VTNTPRLQITEIMYDPEGSGSDLEFIEIINHSEEEIDLTDWGLTGGVEFAFPLGATLPPGEVAVIVKDPVLFGQRYPTLPGSTRIFGPFFGDLADSEEIRLIDAGPGWPATLDRVHYRTHAPWPELRDGYSIELIDPLAAIDNDSGTRWRSSPVLGGTPGTLGPVSGIFVRGDFDGSSVTNLTDAIGMLGYLFLSGDPPSCPDAADVDDDGSLLLNDPIYLLNYLFLSGSMPPAPHPTPGVDPTPDGFDC
ncbi:MAG TPA: lamin tail domain-containing protein, partial [Planctomycetota bacterium]|nr:lamin tail domain-containing protein [Planctomycetota bacterium]